MADEKFTDEQVEWAARCLWDSALGHGNILHGLVFGGGDIDRETAADGGQRDDGGSQQGADFHEICADSRWMERQLSSTVTGCELKSGLHLGRAARSGAGDGPRSDSRH